MDKDIRIKVFEYIYSRANEESFMALNPSESSRFQGELVSDPALEKIAKEKLTRKYIKDTVLNKYSKDQRYILIDDLIAVIEGLLAENIEGKELNNGIFKIKFMGSIIECTSTSFFEWHTALKRFGKHDDNIKRLIFLSCGGIPKSEDEILKAQSEISSYGIQSVIVRPSTHKYKLTELFNFESTKVTPLKNTEKTLHIPKPFLLLAGISGTGKTRFVRQQAKKSGSIKETYQLVSVRPDWHEPSDILGYISRISGQSEYIVSDFLRFLVKAWVEINPTEVFFDDGSIGWTAGPLDDIRPFWLCLDEMNLAPVEQYFADYLSIIETREWLNGSAIKEYNSNNSSEHSYIYKCDPILSAQLLNGLNPSALANLRSNLGISDYLHDKLWKHFCSYGIALPFNLIVAGTVNMDETTHGFSRKVIDRALTFDFGAFFPNIFNDYFSPKSQSIIMSYPLLSNANSLNFISPADKDGLKTITFMNSINSVLQGTPFELAFRAVNEALLSVASSKADSDLILQSVWDDFLMCKVLPRIEGDTDKLTIIGDDESTLLDRLAKVLEDSLSLIWLNEKRIDLYRERPDGSALPPIKCRAKEKIEWMQSRLNVATYTSFWP